MAQKTVAKLNIHLGATTASLQKGFREARTEMKSLEGAAGSFAGRLGAIAAGLAGGFGLAKLSADALSLADRLQNAADRTGLSVTALQSLSWAAAGVGVSVEQLELALVRMQNLIGEAGAGSKAAAAALAAIGLSAQSLAGLSLEQQLAAISQGLSGIADPAQKTRLALDIFGKAGARMLPLVQGGAAGLDQMRASAAAAGAVLSSQTIAAVDGLGDRLGQLKLQGQALATLLVAQIVPAVTSMLDWFASWDAQTVRTVATIGAVTAAIVGAVVVIPKIVSAVGTIIKALRGWAAAKAALLSLEGPRGWLVLAGAAAAAAGAVAMVSSAFDDYEASAAAAAAESQKLAEGAKAAAAAADPGAAEAAKKAADAMKQLRDEGARVTESLRTPVEEAADHLNRLQQLLAAGAISWETYGRGVAKAKAELAAATKLQDHAASAPRVQIAAVTRHSMAGFSAVQAGRSEGERLKAVAEKQLAEARRQSQLLKDLERAVRDRAGIDIKQVSL